MSFKAFDPRGDVSEMEKNILSQWEQDKIFEQSINSRSEGDLYTFYDGPPFATGTPHYGHIVASTIKDVIPRYWTMKGKRVERVWGWDCHGLPIENIVEKELGIKSKKDIEALGVAKFNEICRTKVLEYADEWERIIPRLGRWADMENAYRTMDKDFMESVWWVFKDIYDKGLVYEDYRTMHVCPRCETTLSQSEVTEGYKDVKDLAVTAKFELVSEPGTYVLAWTTTPWTLPGNVALAVGEDIAYAKVRFEDENYIVAKTRIADVFGEKKYGLLEEISSGDLIGQAYKPLWGYYADDASLEDRENGWKIYAADFITDDSGTGIAHEAPAFGADDMALGKQHKLPWVQHVSIDGHMKDVVVDFSGLNVKPIEDHQATDIAIIKNLAHGGLLFSKEKYEHSYPHCWRCDTPLLNYATSSWFVSVLTLKEKFLADAKDINWSPAHIKEGRWGKWLEGARDWSISRQRFWASVIPLWKCDVCDVQEVFGSAKDLEEKSGQEINDLHKHIVDEVTYACDVNECTGVMKRIPDVLDTWFDSGSMPYAQMHYPFENKEKFEANFPADFISEGVDQTRAWFYYLHVLAGGVMYKSAFKNVIVNGIVLAEDGKKMSKKLQNYPDPMETIDTYGADALRLYLMSSPVVNADNLSFNKKDLEEIVRGPLRMLKQSYSFFLMYAEVDGWTSQSKVKSQKSKSILDQWILSELNALTSRVDAAMENYDLQTAARSFAPFIDDLSNWYIRRSRKRFWKSEDDADKENAYTTLHHVLVELSTLMAPFTPFLSEEIYRNLTGQKSVHLEDYPTHDAQSIIDGDIMGVMQSVRDYVSLGLELRAKAAIKVRQPLKSVTLKEDGKNIRKELEEIIKEELNVKEVLYSVLQKDEIILDTVIDSVLKAEGQAREIIRAVQQARKKAGFDLDDRIVLGYKGFEDVFAVHGDLIAHEILATEVHGELLVAVDHREDVKIDDEALEFTLKKM